MNPPQPFCSGRVVKQHERWQREFFQTIHESLEVALFTYDEALWEINANHWQKAMESDIESMYSNHV